MTATLSIVSVSLIILLILFEKVSFKAKLTSPREYRIDLLFLAYEWRGEKKKSSKKLKLGRFFGIYRRFRHRFSAFKYLIKHAEVSRDKEGKYDLVLRFYLFRLCFVLLIIVKERLKYGIKRRKRNVYK